MNNKMEVKGSTVNKEFYEAYSEWLDNNKSKSIVKNDDTYAARLKMCSNVDGKEITFEQQYKEADGNELDKKFWSKISSSRMCFELYSWIPLKYKDIEFAFEKKLTTIISRTKESSSNMDVYIRKNDDIWFIESKFTEEGNTKLAGAYYQSLDKNGNYIDTDYKNPTYYYVAKGDKLASAPQSLSERFRGHDNVIEPFIDFVNDINSFQDKGHQSDWFDAKQETCHLLGIIMYMIDNNEKLEGKTVNFRNIVFNRGGCKEYMTEDKLANHFMEKARAMVQSIMEECNIRVPFTYEAMSIQDVLKVHGGEKAFGYDKDKTVLQSIKDNFKRIEKFL